MNAPAHAPVLCETAVSLLRPMPGTRFVDGTFGRGGHAERLLDAGAEVLGLDLDPDAETACREMASARPALRCRALSFHKLGEALAREGWTGVHGILLDLGVSSPQLDEPATGFSYRADGPLDLRFDRRSGETAAQLLARLDAAAIADLLWRNGEERRSRRIARAIVDAGAPDPIITTGRLRDAVAGAVGGGPRLNATLSRVFQALRIAVNDELTALRGVLHDVPDCLLPGGRLVVIAYHSLEDRIVKHWFREAQRECLCPPEVPICVCDHQRTMNMISRRAVRPQEQEIADNPRARSARLRAGERVS